MQAPITNAVRDITVFDASHGRMLTYLRNNPKLTTEFDRAAVASRDHGVTLFVPHDDDVAKLKRIDDTTARQHVAMRGLPMAQAHAVSSSSSSRRVDNNNNVTGIMYEAWTKQCLPAAQMAGVPMKHEVALRRNGQHQVTLLHPNGDIITQRPARFRTTSIVEATANTPRTHTGSLSIVFLDPSAALDEQV